MTTAMCMDNIRDITSRGRVISFGLLGASEHVLLGFPNLLGFRAYLHHARLINQLEDIVKSLERLEPHIGMFPDEPKAKELVNDTLPHLIKRLDTSLDIIKGNGRLARRESIMRQLLELRNKIYRLWEDYDLLLDREMVDELLASKKRTDEGKVISHDDFWKQVDVQD